MPRPRALALLASLSLRCATPGDPAADVSMTGTMSCSTDADADTDTCEDPTTGASTGGDRLAHDCPDVDLPALRASAAPA